MVSSKQPDCPTRKAHNPAQRDPWFKSKHCTHDGPMVKLLGLMHIYVNQRVNRISSDHYAFGVGIGAFPKQMKHSEISPNYVNKSPTFGPTNNALASIAKDAHYRVDMLEPDGSGGADDSGTVFEQD